MTKRFKYIIAGLILLLCIGLAMALQHMQRSSQARFSLRLGEEQKFFFYPKDLQKSALLLYFISVQCPEGRKNIPKIKNFFEQHSQILDVIFVVADPHHNIEDVKQMIQDFQIDLPWTHDKDLRLSKQLGAQVSSQVILFDQKKWIYSGRIDDQYQIGVDLTEPREENLNIALKQFLDKKNIDPKQTTPFGCALY